MVLATAQREALRVWRSGGIRRSVVGSKFESANCQTGVCNLGSHESARK